MEDRLRHLAGVLNVGGIRREMYQGDEHLVVPVVAVREQVLGNEFLPAEEIERTVKLNMWEGKPLTLGHPMVRGQFVSANHRNFLEERGIGRTFNAEYDSSEKALKLEAWFHVERTNELRPGLVEQIENAGPDNPVVEVSTGYLAGLEPKRGKHNGNQYSGVQRGLVSDHLAVLTNEEGKCSREDGCGLPRTTVNCEGGGHEIHVCTCGGHLEANQSTPEFDGTEDIVPDWVGDGVWDRPNLSDHPEAGEDDDFQELPQGDQSAIRGRFIEQDGDTYAELGNPVVNPQTGRLNRNGVSAAKSRPASEEAGDIADRLWDEHFADEEASENAVVNGLRRLFTQAGLVEPEAGGIEAVDPNLGTRMERTQQEQALVENSEAPFSDRAELDPLSDETVESLHANYCDGEPTDTGGSGDGGGEPDQKGNAGDGVTQIPEPWAEFMENHDPEDVQNAIQDTVQEKEDLVESLDEREDCHLEREELEGMKLNALQRLERSLPEKRADFRAQGGPRGNGSGGDSGSGERADPHAVRAGEGSD